MENKIKKYISNVENALKSIRLQSLSRLSNKDVEHVIKYVRDYLLDSIYYLKEKGDVTNSLISVSYAEGLLDAIKLLKIVDFDWNGEERRDFKAKMNKIVLATGAFDLLHYGHLRFLEESKKVAGKGSRLIVVVARDKTVKARKGTKPVMPENQRRALVEAIKPVDKAILGSVDMNIEDVIAKVKPDIIAVGYDQNDILGMVENSIKRHRWSIKIIQINKFGPKDLNSSTKIKRKIAKASR